MRHVAWTMVVLCCGTAWAETLNDQILRLYREGKFAAAEPLYERTLALCENVFGADHPSTLQVRENYVPPETRYPPRLVLRPGGAAGRAASLPRAGEAPAVLPRGGDRGHGLFTARRGRRRKSCCGGRCNGARA
jgi:hypothetical protein